MFLYVLFSFLLTLPFFFGSHTVPMAMCSQKESSSFSLFIEKAQVTNIRFEHLGTCCNNRFVTATNDFDIVVLFRNDLHLQNLHGIEIEYWTPNDLRKILSLYNWMLKLHLHILCPNL